MDAQHADRKRLIDNKKAPRQLSDGEPLLTSFRLFLLLWAPYVDLDRGDQRAV